MTISQMHNAIKMEIDKTSSLSIASFENEEIDYWINQAILIFINQRYGGLNIKRTSFEETQKRIVDLRTIVTDPVSLNVSIISGGFNYPNGIAYDIPSDHLYSLLDQVNISFISPITGESKSLLVPSSNTVSDLYSIKLRDPYSEHNLYLDYAQPLKFVRGSSIIYITDGNYTINKCYLTYIKQPAVVDLDIPTNCDLPDHTHSEIIKIASNMMLENIESSRYASYSNEVMKIE